jgi:hypothetical protein
VAERGTVGKLDVEVGELLWDGPPHALARRIDDLT